jgi:acetyl-CoA acyltransferase
MRQMGAYKDMLTYNLGRLAVKGLIAKTAIDPSAVDYVTFGTVAQEIRTHNIAREVAIGAGLPMTTAAHTVSQACISSNQAISTGVEKILAGTADVVVAGGSETFSDAPIRFSRKVRQKLIASQKNKGAMAKIGGIVKGLSLSDLAPETPAIKNFATDETMGASSDRLASKWGVSREEQDAFAIRSHANAARATAEGRLKQEIVAVDGNDEDDTIQTALKPKYTTMEAQVSFIYRYILRDSCSQFDSLPLTSLTLSFLLFAPRSTPRSTPRSFAPTGRTRLRTRRASRTARRRAS